SVVLAQATAVAGGCPGNTVTLDIAVLPLPTASLSTIPDQLCWGTTGLVTAVPNTGSTVTDWTLPSGTPAPNQAGPGLYTAHLLGDNGCTSSASIALNQLPPIDWALSGPLGECNNAPAALTVTGNHETATWSTGATGNLLELTAADGPGPFEVTVSLGGCTETDQTTIEWWPVPVIGPLPDTVIHCVLDQPEVWSWPAQAEAPVGWWVWTVNEDVIAGGPAWDTEGDYTIRIFDSMTLCEDTTSVVVDVWPNLDVAAAPLQDIVCWGEETEVLGELRAVEGTNLEEIPYTLSWSEAGIEGLNPTVPAGTYLLTAENACGIAVEIVEVAQEYCGCDMWVPTAFTPDNDGINDGFRVETNCPELDEFRFQVFDRWGELIWSTEDPEAPWVGQGIEGKAMEGQHYIPDGVYGYRLFWKYGELGIPIIEERTGHIHILR
ncbi:MAG: gliding motility-associated C-terminal domain-containing protein, partial [Bacteroidota bacterium]|nr:gliding motility-associated C-terminal domain-containing protein [Bacteroidota bacterium]